MRTTLPSGAKAGPPLLPGLIAASIWITCEASVAAVWRRCGGGVAAAVWRRRGRCESPKRLLVQKAQPAGFGKKEDKPPLRRGAEIHELRSTRTTTTTTTSTSTSTATRPAAAFTGDAAADAAYLVRVLR